MRKGIKLSLFSFFVLMAFSGIAAGQAADDQAIKSAISSSIQAVSIDPANPALTINNVNVESNNGNVTLSGYVANMDAQRQIIDIAKNTPGVKSVNSNLKIYQQR